MRRVASWSTFRRQAGNDRTQSTFSDSWDRQQQQEEEQAQIAVSSANSVASAIGVQFARTGGTATTSVAVTRRIPIPDDERIERCLRLPEYGPRILFFSGGSAIRDLSECLKRYTHNSIHLITPFDSGGSSAEIRRAFDMLSVGDLRNRLMALADDSALGNNAAVTALFSYRLPSDDAGNASREFDDILSGRHVLASAVSMPMRSILLSHVRWFRRDMPPDFDLRGASVGNLIITGCFLEHDRDIVTAIYLIWTLIRARGYVRPLTGANLHIRATYSDGTEEVGQHMMGKSPSPAFLAEMVTCGVSIGSRGRRIVGVDLVEHLEPPPPSPSPPPPSLGTPLDAARHDRSDRPRQEAQTCSIDPVSADLVGTADLIVYPMGSFFGSVLINLVPRGVGTAIVGRDCPKIYIPNTGVDLEMCGYTVAECAGLIVDLVRRDAGVHGTSVRDVVQYILVDTANCNYCVPIDREMIEEMGIRVIDVELVATTNSDDDGNGERPVVEGSGARRVKSDRLDPKKVVEVLISLGS